MSRGFADVPNKTFYGLPVTKKIKDYIFICCYNKEHGLLVRVKVGIQY